MGKTSIYFSRNPLTRLVRVDIGQIESDMSFFLRCGFERRYISEARAAVRQRISEETAARGMAGRGAVKNTA